MASKFMILDPDLDWLKLEHYDLYWQYLEGVISRERAIALGRFRGHMKILGKSEVMKHMAVVFDEATARVNKLRHELLNAYDMPLEEGHADTGD